MTSFSTSSGTSQSSSTGGGSFIPNYPQSSILTEIAQYARSLAPQMLQWGQEQYNKNASLTDQMLADAKVYASPSRISQDMGMAEAGAGMAGDKARENALRDLQSYGIDPSSGRYAALDKAERGKTAAAQAGAGNQQRMATEATGRAMKSEALNAQLSNTNIGANLMRLPNDYLQTASQLKYPPLGQNPQNSQSTSQNQSRSENYTPLTSQPGGGGTKSQPGSSKSPGNQGSGDPRNPFGGGGGGSGPGGGGGYMPQTTQAYGQGDPNNGPYKGPTAYQGAAIHQVPPYGGGDNSGYYDPSSYAQNSNELPSWNQNFDPYSAYDDGSVWGTQDFNTPTSGWGDQYTGMGDGSNWNDGNNFNGDWGANPMSGSDAGSWGDAGQYDFGSYGNTYDTGSSGDTGSWGDTGGYTDYGQTGGSYYGGDSGGQDYGGSDYISSDYAKGGAVGGGAGPGATSGGFVSKQLSPSQGQQVDDVPANLNADEFVVPRDVALWKGQEFFQKLIEQSRKARTMAPAQPTPDQNGDQNAAMGGAMTPGMYQNFNRRVRPPTPAQGAQPFDSTMPSNPGMGGMGGEMSAGPRSRGRSNSFDTMPRNTGYTPPTMLGMG